MEKLHLDITVEPQGDLGGEKIRVGNSGLLVWRDASGGDAGHIDYTPEGHCDAVAGFERQYALQILGALCAFLEWNQTESNPPLQRLQISTNPRMADFVQRNFAPGVRLIEDGMFSKSLELNVDVVTYDPDIYTSLTVAQRQLLRENYYVDDPGL